MSFLRDRIVLITGATGGLGKEMVKQFLAEGSKLILTDLNQSTLTELVEKQAKKGQILFSFASDLSTKEGCQNVYDTIKAKNLEVDILVNNAGVASIGPFLTTPESEWERQYAINLLAPVRLTKLFLKDMSKRNSGHLVNIASVASFVASPGLATYSSTKFGLRAFGEALNEELISTKIRVTNLYPFFTKNSNDAIPAVWVQRQKSNPRILNVNSRRCNS
ncbi:MAG: SDR family oxidoreductase [Leptospiraceae bacterium]|nr:SDR family oxidoreductase [Leptospiraceae bacterium]